MSEYPVHKVSPQWAQSAHINKEKYQALYQQSIDNPESFWAEQAKRIDWFKPFSKVRDFSYDESDLHIKWFEDGELNICHNCVDRHLPEKANDTAIIWEGDEPTDDKTLTYSELKTAVSRFANVLKGMGVQKAMSSRFTCQ